MAIASTLQTRPITFQLVTVDLAAQVTADSDPAFTAIIGAEQAFGAEIQPVAVMRGNDQRRIPVPVVVILIGARLRRDVQAFAGDAVKTAQ